MQKLNFPLLGLLLIGSLSAVSGQSANTSADVKLIDGRNLESAKIIGIAETGITIVHAGGVEIVPAESVPLEMLARAHERLAKQSDARTKAASAIKERDQRILDARRGTTVTTNDSGTLAIPLPHRQRSAGGFALVATGQESPKLLLENACIVASTASGTGTGFILRQPDGYTLVTNQHVIDGGAPHKYELPDGRLLKPLTGRIATDRDLAIFDLEGRFENAFEMEADLNDVALGEEVIVYGNSLGQGMRLSKAQIVAKGKYTLEVSGGIVPGNSGGPIVRAKNRKVVGVSTFATVAGDNPRTVQGIITAKALPKVRFYGVRIDKLSDVTEFDLPTFVGSHNSLAADEARLDRGWRLLILFWQKLGNRLTNELATAARSADPGVVQTVELLQWSKFTIGTINVVDVNVFRRAADPFFAPVGPARAYIHARKKEELESYRAALAKIYRDLLGQIPAR